MAVGANLGRAVDAVSVGSIWILQDGGVIPYVEPSDEEKLSAIDIAAINIDARNAPASSNEKHFLDDQTDRLTCYNWGTRVWGSMVNSYFNQLCHENTGGYYVGAGLAMFLQLTGINLVSFFLPPYQQLFFFNTGSHQRTAITERRCYRGRYYHCHFKKPVDKNSLCFARYLLLLLRNVTERLCGIRRRQ